MRTVRINFKNKSGKVLSGLIDYPNHLELNKCLSFAIFAHCFTCSKNLKVVSTVSKALTQLKIAVLRFDFTGLGQSEGDFSDTNFSSNVSDLVQGAKYLENNYHAPSIIIGHSLGGAAVLKVANQIASLKVVCVIGAPFEPSHVSHHFDNQREEIEKKGKSRVKLVGRDFVIKKQFLEDLKKSDLSQDISNFKKPLLILHSPIDNTVGIENAARIFQYAKHPKSFISLDKADHLLSKESDAFYAGEVIGSWAKKYLNLKEPISTYDPNGEIIILNKKKDDYKTSLNLKGFEYIADEPKEVGGSEMGAGPSDYLLGSLGACTAITLRMYANRKNWDLQKVSIILKSNKNPKTFKTTIIRSLLFTGNLSEKEKKRLLEIANKCPLHKILESEIEIISQLI